MVGTGGLDHGIDALGRHPQGVGVVEVAKDGIDAGQGQRADIEIVTHQPGHLVTRGHQPLRDRPPQVTGCARDEYLHRSSRLSLCEQTSFGW